ncbi:MAG TPA: hypothetical protein VLF79_00130 [Candidatus Saccharimonadales bacterium]|nr:hypothetical protein [Candidatus Saccharimonadales bacterium]
MSAKPHIDNVLWLARLSMPFPATAGNITEIARSWRFSDSTLEFLELFPKDEIFTSRSDFLNRCEELELLMRDKASMPPEPILSQQD